MSGKPDIRNRKELWLNLIKADSNERYDEIAETEDITMTVNVICDMLKDIQVN